MDEKKLREVYETIQIEDGVYRNLVASALRKQREKGGKRRRRIAVMRYALSAASVVLILTGLVMFTARVPFKYGVASLTTLAQETTSEAVSENPGMESREEETLWSVADLIYVDEYSILLNSLTETQKKVIFDGFEMMEKQERFKREMNNMLSEPMMQDGFAELFDETPIKIYYGVPELLVWSGGIPGEERCRELYEQAVEDDIYGNLPFTEQVISRQTILYEGEDGAVYYITSPALEDLYMVRAQKQIAGVEDGTVMVIELETGFFFAEYRTFEQEMMVVSTGYYRGDCAWLNDIFLKSRDIIISDKNGLKSRRIYSEEQREMYVTEPINVYYMPSDNSRKAGELQQETVIELGTVREWSCIKVDDTIRYVKSEYLSEWIPVTKIVDEEILVSAEYEDQIPPTRMTEEYEEQVPPARMTEEYEEQIPPTRMTEE